MNAAQPKPIHPGTIAFVDGERTQTRPAAELPDSLQFAMTSSGWVPVVRVVAVTQGNRRFVREYGPDGQELRSTVQLKAPDAP